MYLYTDLLNRQPGYIQTPLVTCIRKPIFKCIVILMQAYITHIHRGSHFSHTETHIHPQNTHRHTYTRSLPCPGKPTLYFMQTDKAGTRTHTCRPTHTQACSHTCCRGTRGQLCGCSCDLQVPGASVWTMPHHFLLHSFQFQTRTPDSLPRPSHPFSSLFSAPCLPSVQCFWLPLS